MEHEFLPAIVPYVIDPRAWRSPIHWLGQDPSTLAEGYGQTFNEAGHHPSIYYPRVLTSFVFWKDDPIWFNRGAEHSTVFGDSGGYSLVTGTAKDIKLDPTDVIQWQIKECTRGVMLDVPPYRMNGGIQFRGSAAEWWNESLSRTEENVRRALPYYQAAREAGSEFRWWGVVQGENRSQMEAWYKRVAALYPFKEQGEGWALAPKPSTELLSNTRYLRFAHDYGLPRIHLLQVTADRVVGLLMALANISGRFELITYDSASAARCAINRSAIIPNGIGQRYIKEKRKCGIEETCPTCLTLGWDCHCDDNERTVQDTLMQCPCAACAGMRKDAPLTNAEYPHYILLHNHIQMVESFERIWEAARSDPDKVLRWACGKQYGPVLQEWEKTVFRAKPQTHMVTLADRLRG